MSILRKESTPRTGGDAVWLVLTAVRVVSIHAPVLGATRRVYVPFVATVFQSTPPRWGRLPARAFSR